jgi:hypothetical protein
VFTVNQDDNILHFQAILFEERRCFKDAAPSCDEVIDDKSGIALSEVPLDASLTSPFGMRASVY